MTYENFYTSPKSETPSERANRIGAALGTMENFRFPIAQQAEGSAAMAVVRAAGRQRTTNGFGGARIISDIGTGKTVMLEAYRDFANHDAAEGTCPVLLVTLDPKGTPDTIAVSILEALRVTRPSAGDRDRRWDRAIDELRRHQVELVIFDELDRANRRPTMSGQVATSIRLKIMDGGICPVVFCGADAARTVLRSVPELIQRLGGTIRLDPFNWFRQDDKARLIGFLKRWDEALVDHKVLPALSGLSDEKVAQLLCESSGGNLRMLCKILQNACLETLRAKRLKIERDDLKRAVLDFAVDGGFIEHNPFDRPDA